MQPVLAIYTSNIVQVHLPIFAQPVFRSRQLLFTLSEEGVPSGSSAIAGNGTGLQVISAYVALCMFDACLLSCFFYASRSAPSRHDSYNDGSVVHHHLASVVWFVFLVSSLGATYFCFASLDHSHCHLHLSRTFHICLMSGSPLGLHRSSTGHPHCFSSHIICISTLMLIKYAFGVGIHW